MYFNRNDFRSDGTRKQIAACEFHIKTVFGKRALNYNFMACGPKIFVYS